MSQRRAVITGMAVNTPIGDTLTGFYEALLAGQSAITHWHSLDVDRIDAKIGGDLGAYDWQSKIKRLADHLPPDIYQRAFKLVKQSTFSTRLTLLTALNACLDANLFTQSLEEVAIIVGGHNFYQNYDFSLVQQYLDEPAYIDAHSAFKGLDTNQGAAISAALGSKGVLYTIGGACASTNMAMRSALDEIRHHGIETVLVVGPLYDYSPVTLQALAIIGAVSIDHFQDQPAAASRPFDVRREGFVPAHGIGAMVIELESHAQQREQPAYAELVGVSATSAGTNLPSPSAASARRTLEMLLKETGIAPQQIGYVNAHATSTPQGDLAEVEALQQVFGSHLADLKVNATKSMLGHCCWSSGVIESIGAILQIRGRLLHPSINIDQLAPEIQFEVCAGKTVPIETEYFMKNAFGFGGIHSAALFRYAPEEFKQ